MVHYLSFPGLGIGEFAVNRVAFTVFGHPVMWYGIIITSAIVLACLYIMWRAKERGISSDTVLDYAIFTVVLGIIGARTYYVLTTLHVYQYDSFLDVIAVWNGGLAIYGGILGGALAIWLVSRRKKINPLVFLDCTAPAVMMAQAIGRWGNFMNAEAHGGETDLPWRMGIRSAYSSETIFVHPTFLYESLWNLLGFVLINLYWKHRKFDGEILLLYLAWYGFGRALIEGLRTDSLYVGPFRISQLLGAFFFLAGVSAIIVIRIRLRKKEKKENEK